MKRTGIAAYVGFCLMASWAGTAGAAEAYWPAGAEVYFAEPKDGAVISGPVKVVMGVKGIEIAPAGTDKPATGHHHILIDTDVPTGDQAGYPLPADDHVKHFGKGQTETTLDLAPGKHTLQLAVGDGNHIPHDPALKSKKITITVK
jgi:Domain of unknown function (DUF4399)